MFIGHPCDCVHEKQRHELRRPRGEEVSQILTAANLTLLTFSQPCSLVLRMGWETSVLRGARPFCDGPSVSQIGKRHPLHKQIGKMPL